MFALSIQKVDFLTFEMEKCVVDYCIVKSLFINIFLLTFKFLKLCQTQMVALVRLVW